ncbi:unnamed protein product [Microthlaspi erraticum]|uniref:Uncharacterized protein n=1 Tax=Microthlaspi erraticum TaxID=1685480 RepID=A0A6D2JXJ1_9BRAS|nr:unnamed protein product [Microthlaspi erraticum]
MDFIKTSSLRALSELTFQRNWIGIIWMSRNEVMIKLVKTGPDGLIEHSRPNRAPADRGTNIPRSSRAQHPRHPAKSTAELTYRPGKHRPAVEPFQPRHHKRTTARANREAVSRPRGTSRPRPIHPSDRKASSHVRPRIIGQTSIRPTRRPNAKTLGHDRSDRADSRPRPDAGRSSRPTVRTVRSTRSPF